MLTSSLNRISSSGGGEIGSLVSSVGLLCPSVMDWEDGGVGSCFSTSALSA